MSDLISRNMAITHVNAVLFPKINTAKESEKALRELPAVERKGKWDERKVFDTKGSGIEEMQSAKCSACGKYHTTPFLYFFDNFNYCPNCGADMRGNTDETD